MANPFINGTVRDVETAILLEKAKVVDIGKAVAYTDGQRTFINTEDNLFSILPAYTQDMLKWLLWHEEYHKQLRHHNRFYKYLDELSDRKTRDEFHLSKEEVNIIMDILVHDSLAKMFPEIVETAKTNLAQMRNQNSLGYTFKTFTLEEMLDEYKRHKKPDEDDKDEDEGDEGKGIEKPEDDEDSKDKSKDGKSPKGHKEGGHSKLKDDIVKDTKPPEVKDAEKPLEDEHSKTDWSKLDELDSREFITEGEGDAYEEQINKLRRAKFKLAKLSETLNGLATTTKRRTYRIPSTIQVSHDIILKGRMAGKTKLYLCFDASGSMGLVLDTFKEIISKSIPQALDCPCEWFSGDGERIDSYKRDYYKGKFKDILPVDANSGYGDDGDRTIEMCYLAEQKGYSPIGITDGGGQISWSKDMLKKLKRTVFVGQDKRWLDKVKEINPILQTIDIERG